MASPEHLAKLNEGVEAWNAWRRTSGKLAPDLQGASLVGLDLTEADLSGAILEFADLSSADLSATNFIRANLCSAKLASASLMAARFSGASLRRADVSRASLGGSLISHADLREANFTSADLTLVDLTGSDLTGTIFTRARIGDTTFALSDLSVAVGLDTVEHKKPSIISIDTIYCSQGKIPFAFLRGCGIPEIFIQFLPSLVAPGAIQFYSCFISYSTKDQEFADRLYADLQNKGVRCWFAPHDVQGGKKLHEQIDDAIRMHQRLLLILSPNSIASKWVETEIRNARNRELAEAKRVLFPVRLSGWDELKKWKLFNADEGKDLATEIREYYIPDFSEWKNHDSYAREFEKLLRDLRTGEGNDPSAAKAMIT